MDAGSSPGLSCPEMPPPHRERNQFQIGTVVYYIHLFPDRKSI